MKIEIDGEWIRVDIHPAAGGQLAGTISSSLTKSSPDSGDEFMAAMNAMESMILAHACAGIDVSSPAYVQGIRACIDACDRNYN